MEMSEAIFAVGKKGEDCSFRVLRDYRNDIVISNNFSFVI